MQEYSDPGVYCTECKVIANSNILGNIKFGRQLIKDSSLDGIYPLDASDLVTSTLLMYSMTKIK